MCPPLSVDQHRRGKISTFGKYHNEHTSEYVTRRGGMAAEIELLVGMSEMDLNMFNSAILKLLGSNSL